MSYAKLIIDRFDGMWAVVDYLGYQFNIPRRLLPEGLRKGDMVTANFSANEGDTKAHSYRTWNEATH